MLRSHAERYIYAPPRPTLYLLLVPVETEVELQLRKIRYSSGMEV